MHSNWTEGETKIITNSCWSPQMTSSGQFKFSFRLQLYFINMGLVGKIEMYHENVFVLTKHCFNKYRMCLSLPSYHDQKLCFHRNFPWQKAILDAVLGGSCYSSFHHDPRSHVWIWAFQLNRRIFLRWSKTNKNIFIINVCSSNCH